MIQRAGTGAEPFCRRDVERGGQTSIERFLCIAFTDDFLVAEESLDHWVLTAHEFDDHVGSAISEPADEVGQRNVSSDGQVVHEGQADHEIRPASCEEGRPFQAPPAQRRCWVGDIAEQWQDISRRFLLQRAIRPLYGEMAP